MLFLVALLSNSCKKDIKKDIKQDKNSSYDNLKQLMTEKQQVCVYTYWVTEVWEGSNMVSRSSELMSVSCSSGGGTSGGGGTGDPIATPIKVELKPDSLKKKFPCAAQILESLESYPQLSDFLAPFIKIGADSVKANLSWFDDPKLDWNSVGSTTYGETRSDPKQRVGSEIYLNSNMLKNSSPALISTVMVHEMIHAYFNNITTMQGYDVVADDSKPILERLSEYAKVSASLNGRDHLTILASYVGTIAEVVGLSDGNKKSKEVYFKLAIGSLNNDGKTPSNTFASTYKDLLDKINKDNKFSITIDNASQMISLNRSVPKSERAKCLL
ncbi:SprT-like domain-containing protein [Pedobacter sp. PAMC26386]|nr:SprT-like domain-containing protein [Pedobacter sp. PAMC26386]